MSRKSQHNISRANIWENTFSNIRFNNKLTTIKKVNYAVFTQEVFGSEYIDDIFSKWDKIYSNVFYMLKDLRAKLMSNTTLELPNIDSRQPLTIEQEKMIKAQNDVKYSLEKLPTYFNTLDENTIIVKFKDIIKFLGDNVGVSVTSVKDIEKNFEKNSIEKILPTTLKDNLNARVSDNTVLCNLALISALACNQDISFNFLTEELSKQLDNILQKYPPNLQKKCKEGELSEEEKKKEEKNEEERKKINTDNFKLALDFFKENITHNIPFSSDIIYQIIYISYVNTTYDRVHKPLKHCIQTLERIISFLKNYIDYTNDTKLLKKISILFFNQEIDKEALNALKKEWTSKLSNLKSCKKQTIEEYRNLSYKIALENEPFEHQTFDDDNETIEIFCKKLKETKNNIEKYYSFVSNISTSTNFDQLWYIIKSLAKMKSSISDCFIDIFMEKVKIKHEISNIKTDISFDDMRKLVNNTHLSQDNLRLLTELRFDELTDKEWNFIYHLSLVKNKKLVKALCSFLKIYCEKE